MSWCRYIQHEKCELGKLKHDAFKRFTKHIIKELHWHWALAIFIFDLACTVLYILPDTLNAAITAHDIQGSV